MQFSLKAMNPTGAPPETKVFAQFNTAWITGAVTWALTTWVFKGQLPAPLATFLPYIVPVACGLLAGWLAKHTPRQLETEAIALLQQLIAQQQAQAATAPGAVRFVTPGVGGSGGGGGGGAGGGMPYPVTGGTGSSSGGGGGAGS